MVNMRPVPACNTSSRGAPNLLGPGRCTITKISISSDMPTLGQSYLISLVDCVLVLTCTFYYLIFETKYNSEPALKC